jgi:hypothetical protein
MILVHCSRLWISKCCYLVTAASFLEIQNQEFSGHMVAVMDLKHLQLLSNTTVQKEQGPKTAISSLVKHSFTKKCVVDIRSLIGFG